MTFVTAHRTQISLADLHDLQRDDFTEIVIEVRRRAEPGAGAFSGVQFLSHNESVACFETVTEALTFIDNLHTGGIVHAVGRELVNNSDIETITHETVVEELQFYNDDYEPEHYLQLTGLENPMNLQIIPHKETVEPVSGNENPTTDNTANTDVEV